MKKTILTIITSFIITLLFAQTYTPNDASSKVRFVIKNFGIKTGGSFSGLKGSITFNPKALTNSSFNVTVNSSTVDTDNSTRDKHLKKDEYFGVEKHPTIKFESTKITESNVAGRFYVVGNLAIKGITKEVKFGFSATPTSNGYLFKGEFEVNRRDFGVGGSSVSLSDNLKVNLEINANK